MEDFYTIQGEGFYQGHAAYFVRLGGCDVGCVWCDVKESWDASLHPMLSIAEIVSRVKTGKGKIVVITGGEPVMYNLEKLTHALKDSGLRTHIETSGVYPLTGTWDWVCFSPKKFKKPDTSIFEKADELKVIINHKSDIAWAEEFTSKLKPSCQLFLQPEWSKEKEMLPLIIEYVKDNPKWQVSLQVHKYMNIP
ncbi:7-carboxy-7-deazaguanine synthase QueE [Pseudochryseolinea flava]|uniref:7-carboxy-7-deazaguanine synthase n=1 Tax=Pseudochryseolinea flava TaxID=2059302 RepID=A0A364Y1I0_9BACT|nr:7-carboxy-7-deazaguanine synthase QueE [Pseudochryseolinea flava]RAV99936.1 7-carboxy-7-deazaguanine synthase QueE [Pseudochryseolinea flava]